MKHFDYTNAYFSIILTESPIPCMSKYQAIAEFGEVSSQESMHKTAACDTVFFSSG